MTAGIGAVQHICQKLYQTGLYRFGVVTQPEKGKVSRSAKNSALGSLFLVCGESFLVHFYYNALVINIDSRLPIVLFVG